MYANDVESLILHHLYQAFFLPEERDVDIRNIVPQDVLNDTPVSNLINELIGNKVILGWRGGITPFGVSYAERRGIAPVELKGTNLKIRAQLLEALAKVYEQQGNLYSASSNELAQQINVDKKPVVDNLRVLESSHQVDFRGNARFRITSSGLRIVAALRQQTQISEDFERVSQLAPQPRGRALEQIIARVIGEQGWNTEGRVRTSNEEMDVIISREREFYLLECKWEKEPVESNVLRELFGKLSNRFDVRGIVLSMSGFTRGSEKQAHDYVGQRVILLFGPKDTESLINGQTAFDDLLNVKYNQLISRKMVLYE